jgi:polyhydroxyalkanoate synthesis regulator phasin
MYKDMVEADASVQPKQKSNRERSPALTKAEYAAVSRAAERQRVMLTAANEQLQAATTECTQKRTEVERLRERVRDLEEDNARLRAKVIALGGNPDN